MSSFSDPSARTAIGLQEHDIVCGGAPLGSTPLGAPTPVGAATGEQQAG
mgnify:CR=1 FL=1